MKRLQLALPLGLSRRSRFRSDKGAEPVDLGLGLMDHTSDQHLAGWDIFDESDRDASAVHQLCR